jgi:hypothetical protein
VDRNSQKELFEGTPAGGQIIAILIGLLNQQGKSIGAIGGSVQFLVNNELGDGSVRSILPFIEQQN